ncbi:MAG: hypothetical protein DRH50_11990 [Deltaproteobacteria bacterium]|nr:MAG: hypothetical protein DRH50_11990 [Deltaproteobacteria bacterium]
MKLFISYKFNSQEELFVQRIYFYIKKQPDINPIFFPHHGTIGSVSGQLESRIDLSDVLIFFWGSEIGDMQRKEARYALDNKKSILPVKLPGRCKITVFDDIDELNRLNSVKVSDLCEESALRCAKRIVELLGGRWIRIDGLPIGYPFNYEKDIINEFIKGEGKLSKFRVQQGCPIEWPELLSLGIQKNEDPVSQKDIGTFRDWDEVNRKRKDPKVIPVALSDYHKCYCPEKLGLTFAEAGPRKFHYYPSPSRSLKVGILVSGGIAPGINAVISGIVKRQVLYAQRGRYDLDILGYPEGFKPLILRGRGAVNCPDYKLLYSTSRQISMDLSSYADEAGSILPTSRMSRLNDLSDPRIRSDALKKIVNSLDFDRVDILYVIGGDGSMKAAHAVWNYAKDMNRELSVVAIPKTMDNDILWVWQSFGFLSAVEWAKGAIRQLYQEAKANPRVGVIQLFGSDSGFVVSHAALASGVCDLALIPEIEFNMSRVVEHVKERLKSRFRFGTYGESPYCIILMAENAIPKDAMKYINISEVGISEAEKRAIVNFEDNKRRVYGKTPDDLRNAGLKIVSKVLQMKIREMSNPYWSNFYVFTNEPRHLIRSIPPSSSDIIFGERLGSLAVDCGMAGYTDFMISQWLTEYVMVPLQLVVLGRKRIPTNGIFWKSVIAKTGQPANLT